MRSTYRRPHANASPGERRRRAISIGLTIAAHLLILWLLLYIQPTLRDRPSSQSVLTTFDALPQSQTAAPTPRAKAVAKASASAKASATKPADVVAPPVDTPPPPIPPADPIFAGGKALFDAADISKLGSKTADSGADGKSDGKDSVAAYGPGAGPGGQQLYNAEWYREPSDAELRGYLPAGVPPNGWGIIACKTIPDYQVENCRSLGESPIGSGIARALRQAAWQFRVRPPRIGGKPVIGAWVRIRIDFTKKAAE